MITPETMRSIIKAETKLAEIPMNCTMQELGLTNAQLEAIQRRCLRMLKHTPSIIFFRDTVYDITDRINKKPAKETL